MFHVPDFIDGPYREPKYSPRPPGVTKQKALSDSGLSGLAAKETRIKMAFLAIVPSWSHISQKPLCRLHSNRGLFIYKPNGRHN